MLVPKQLKNRKVEYIKQVKIKVINQIRLNFK